MESPSGIKVSTLHALMMVHLLQYPKYRSLYVKLFLLMEFVIPIFIITILISVQIILVTHPKAGDLREPLKYIYNLYVEYVVKNPLYSPGTPIK